MTGHYQFCRHEEYYVEGEEVTVLCDCDLIAKVRADEREFLAPEVPWARDDLRNVLRAKVEALHLDAQQRGDIYDMDDVLALIDGEGL